MDKIDLILVVIYSIAFGALIPLTINGFKKMWKTLKVTHSLHEAAISFFDAFYSFK